MKTVCPFKIQAMQRHNMASAQKIVTYLKRDGRLAVGGYYRAGVIEILSYGINTNKPDALDRYIMADMCRHYGLKYHFCEA